MNCGLKGLTDTEIVNRVESINRAIELIGAPFYAVCSSRDYNKNGMLSWRRLADSCTPGYVNARYASLKETAAWLKKNCKASLAMLMKDREVYAKTIVAKFGKYIKNGNKRNGWTTRNDSDDVQPAEIVSPKELPKGKTGDERAKRRDNRTAQKANAEAKRAEQRKAREEEQKAREEAIRAKQAEKKDVSVQEITHGYSVAHIKTEVRLSFTIPQSPEDTALIKAVKKFKSSGGNWFAHYNSANVKLAHELGKKIVDRHEKPAPTPEKIEKVIEKVEKAKTVKEIEKIIPEVAEIHSAKVDPNNDPAIAAALAEVIAKLNKALK